MSFEIAVQTAVYNQLSNSSQLNNSVKGIFDHVPQKTMDCSEIKDTQFPFVSIGDALHNEWDTDNSLGNDVIITVHTWSREKGRKQIKELQGMIYDLLHRSNLFYSGFDFISCDFQGSESFRDSDGLTYHGVQTFRILIGKIGG